MKFSIVDDNKSFRKGLQLYLTLQLNYEIIAEAGSGEEALQSSKIYKSDIIFMDIHMEDLSGFETAKQIQQEKWNIKIIALSMYDELIFLSKLVSAGFKGYVPKRRYYSILPSAIDTVLKGNLFFPLNLKI
ncbi:MAG: response regulator transcription factor [bacterium]|nr:response regulator transcription factor [bacterium]